MNLKVKLFFLALLIATIAIQGYSIYAHTTAVKNGWKSGSWCYMVHPCDYIADDCWNLTDPDQYILAAIQNPDELTEPFDYGYSTFWFIAPWYDHFDLTLYDTLGRRPKPFLYNGTCYDYNAIPMVDLVEYPSPKPEPVKPEHTAVGLAVVWVAAGSVYILKNRKAKSEP